MTAGHAPEAGSTDTAESGDALLGDLLGEAPETCLADAESCLARARLLGDCYRDLDRARLGADRVLELKFACLYWRRRLLARLHDDPPAWLRADHTILPDIIETLGTRLPDAVIRRLAGYLPRRTHHHLLALQGNAAGELTELDTLAGPGVTLDIRANRSSPWPFERWKRNPAFGRYAFRDDGVDFRGVHFRPGDILLANVNIDGNGVYTALSDPRRFASHAAVFVVLEDDTGRYPAVVETYEKGVRAVPLNVFVDARFSAYVEVYRHTEIDEQHASRVSTAARELIERVRGYNFNTAEDDWDYVSCCGVGRLLHLAAGLEPASPKSRIAHPGIRDNLRRLDYDFLELFAPVDYLLDPRFQCVGWIDNHQFESLLARELAEGYFRELFMTRTLEPRRFPFRTRVNRWGIGHIRRRSPLGRLIARVERFDHLTLPKGPDPLLAVITVAEAEVGRAVKRTRRWLEQQGAFPDRFSLEEFARRPDVRERIESSMRLAWLD